MNIKHHLEEQAEGNRFYESMVSLGSSYETNASRRDAPADAMNPRCSTYQN